MDSLLDEHSLFATKGGLYKVIENVDDSIKALEIAQRSCLICKHILLITRQDADD